MCPILVALLECAALPLTFFSIKVVLQISPVSESSYITRPSSGLPLINILSQETGAEDASDVHGAQLRAIVRCTVALPSLLASVRAMLHPQSAHDALVHAAS
jgi:hypothetical protein